MSYTIYTDGGCAVEIFGRVYGALGVSADAGDVSDLFCLFCPGAVEAEPERGLCGMVWSGDRRSDHPVGGAVPSAADHWQCGGDRADHRGDPDHGSVRHQRGGIGGVYGDQGIGSGRHTEIPEGD